MTGALTETKEKFYIYLKLKDVKKAILAIFIIFLPFGQALTINLFFPLKISEIGTLLFLAYSIGEFLFYKDLWVKPDKVTVVVLIFILIVFTSTILNFFSSYSYDLDLTIVRTSKNVDSFLKFFYLILAFLAMRMTYVSVKRFGSKTVLKWFFWGAIIASLYAWYLSISSLLKIPYLRLPGMDPQPQTLNLSFGSIVRCGTFKEGNYMGLYLFIAGVLATYSNKIRLAAFFFITIITTFSTVSFVCVLIYILFNGLKSKGSKISGLIGLGILAILLGVLMQKSDDFRTIVVNKIFASEEDVENPNDVVSRLDRLNTTQIGFEMFADNPVWGVGPANFGLHFDHYNELPKFGEGDYKRIANNIYIEMLSESGIFALLLFLAFVVIIVKRSLSISSRLLYMGLILTFIYLIAFPTYTTLYLWFFWGFVEGHEVISHKRMLAA